MVLEETKGCYIGEITGEVSLFVSQGEKSALFKTTVIEGEGETVDIEPIVYKDRVVLFDTKGLSLRLEGRHNNRMVEFPVQSISKVVLENGAAAHRLRSGFLGNYKNFREYKRFSLGDTGAIRINVNDMPVKCIVHDISYRGMCVGIKGHNSISIQKVLNLTFDHKRQRVVTHVNAQGIVVRSSYDSDRDETLYGIKLERENPAVTQVVNDVQREELIKLRHAR